MRISNKTAKQLRNAKLHNVSNSGYEACIGESEWPHFRRYKKAKLKD
jgi:hypothetical protein